MAAYFCMLASLCVAVSAAPPTPPRLYQQHASAQLQQINPYDYYLENSEVSNYYNQPQQKQGDTNAASNGAPSRLESLEPDSEVELIPGAQQPQQPPQQTPVSPNLPGLVPGQRVFIVHMPVPGYRPGTIGGYQPVYIVAAAPQGNTGFPANGYQNAILLDPSGQTIISPLLGYPRQGLAGVAPGTNPGLILGAPLTLNRPFELAYQEPVIAYQSPNPTCCGHACGRPGVAPQDATRGSVRLSQFVGLQRPNANPSNNPRIVNNESAAITEPKRLAQASESNETKEVAEEPRRNARPTPPHAQIRNKP